MYLVDPNDFRLDEMQAGFRTYFGHHLSLAPIRKPERILELGAGSGAWAIQAAQMYPEAEVIAVDIAPLPQRPLPVNVKYIQFDLTSDSELPLAPGTSDVVHLRLTLVHIPNASDVLRRLTKLIKPGGWLLVEDIDHKIYSDKSGDVIHAGVVEALNDYLRPKGTDPQIGAKLESVLIETGLFSEVNAIKVCCPLSPAGAATADLKLQSVGETFKRSMILRTYFTMVETTSGSIFTRDAVEALEKELDDPSQSYVMDIYVVSAQRFRATGPGAEE